MAENSFKLEKLKINAFTNADDREQRANPASFEVMFNPESFSMFHWNKLRETGKGAQTDYLSSQSSRLSLDLIFDSTGVTALGIASGKAKSVSTQVSEFLDTCFENRPEMHEPNYLKIQWGDAGNDSPIWDFNCRLRSVDITYKLFDRNGEPLRAELRTVFIEDELQQNETSSPDLTHTRTVKAGDTLPLLTRQIYGSEEYYLRVAQANNLDDFRNLKPGQELVFPPLEKQQ